MKRTMLFAAGFALSASVAASTMVFADQPTVLKVDVDSELNDMENANALEFWSNIEADLKKAILAHAADRLPDKGYGLFVQVREISLSGSTVLTGAGEFNHLEVGSVSASAAIRFRWNRMRS